MYYGKWCPKCEKPTVELVPQLNMLKAFAHLKTLNLFHVVLALQDQWESRIHNDTAFKLCFDEPTPEEQVFKDTFNLGDSIMLYVSW